ncbi:unannotated protein [freshwater metagenome]|uniref:Unannotated protein n=1 Tax=freshwater metagenome TaxID=449393 RepID=A0A6J6HSN5_9ZZZZ|nr:hypothetical protein [Actinomycetota bacterium]
MTADEFDKEHLAPLAPDERMWRHPAEHADVERNKHLSHVPPLGRRLTALTAAVCVVASMAILATAVPKGISDYIDSEAVAGTSAPTIPPVKSAAMPLLATVNGAKGSTTAVSLGHGSWLVSADAIDITERMWITPESGEEIQVQYLSTSDNGLATLLHLTTETSNKLATQWGNYLTPENSAELRQFSIVDILGVHHLTEEESFQLRENIQTLPLNLDTPISGAAAVVDERMSAVGIVVKSKHSTYFLHKSLVLSLLRAPRQPAP